MFREAVGLKRGPLSLVRIMGSYFNEKYGFRSRKTRLTAVRTRRTNHAKLFSPKNVGTKSSPTSGGSSVGVVRLRNKSQSSFLLYIHTHTHTHTHIYIYIRTRKMNVDKLLYETFLYLSTKMGKKLIP
jgi:hypothetical protein